MEVLVKKESKEADRCVRQRLGLQYLKEVGVRKGLTEKSVLDAGREPRGELLQASAINTEFSQGTQLTPIHFVETHLVSTIMT